MAQYAAVVLDDIHHPEVAEEFSPNEVEIFAICGNGGGAGATTVDEIGHLLLFTTLVRHPPDVPLPVAPGEKTSATSRRSGPAIGFASSDGQRRRNAPAPMGDSI